MRSFHLEAPIIILVEAKKEESDGRLSDNALPRWFAAQRFNADKGNEIPRTFMGLLPPEQIGDFLNWKDKRLHIDIELSTKSRSATKSSVSSQVW